MSGNSTVRMFLCDSVHVRRRACLDGIALQALFASNTPTIVHTVPMQNYIRIATRFYVGKAIT